MGLLLALDVPFGVAGAGPGAVGQGRLIEVSRVTVWRWVQQAVLRATEAGQIPQGRKCVGPIR